MFASNIMPIEVMTKSPWCLIIAHTKTWSRLEFGSGLWRY